MQAINEEELNKILKRAQELVLRGNINVVTINKQKLIVFQDGTILRNFRGLYYKLVENADNGNRYNVINCGGKLFYRHRIISYAFLKLDIVNGKLLIDHIDDCRINNHVNNLPIVTQQQNLYNTKAKDYYLNKN